LKEADPSRAGFFFAAVSALPFIIPGSNETKNSRTNIHTLLSEQISYINKKNVSFPFATAVNSFTI
jgi:hypothetical protein